MEVEASQTPPPEQTFKAFTVMRKDGNWVCLTLHIGVDKDLKPRVIEIESSQPDLKAIALERFKILAYNWWTKL